ncbi:MAG: pilin [bacterium]
MNKYFAKILASTLTLLIVLSVASPFLAKAEDGSAFLPLIQCGNTLTKNADGALKTCDFTDFVATIGRIINWISAMAMTISTIVLIYGGFLYMTSGDSAGDRTKANNMMWNVIKGYVIILAAWLVVKTLLVTLTGATSGDKNGILRFFGK